MLTSVSYAKLTACAVAAATAIIYLQRRRWRRKALSFVPWENLSEAGESVLVVDCTHPKLRCLTHHKMPYSPPQEIRGDSSSDMVLNALQQDHAIVRSVEKVSVNHFDIDAFVSVWSLLNPELALEHLDVLHAASNIGDFRELDLSVRGAELGLKACCWLNTVERNLFSRPFEPGDRDKWPYFLGEGRFASFLRDPEPFRADWKEEHTRVLEDVRRLEAEGRVRYYADISLCVVESPSPLHYYALFGPTRGYDIVLASYGDGGRYEIEQKYTQFVNLASRPTHPRVEMDKLVAALNALEASRSGASTAQSADDARSKWVCERIVDSGPLVRLEAANQRLTKAERYGHPYERPIHSSTLALPRVEELLVTYLRHALNATPRKSDWRWAELHAFNDAIDWSAWPHPAVAQ